MATGDVIILREGDVATPHVPSSSVLTDPEQACAMALAAYLKCQTFTVWGGEPADPTQDRPANRTFQLINVFDDYPDANDKMVYPSASIVPRQDSSFSEALPHALENTWDEKAGTVLWNLGDATGTFQVSFWADMKPVRDAMAAAIGRLFNPREVRGVLLRLPEIYACAVGRFTLTQPAVRINLPGKAYTNEWELRAIVTWDAPLLEMREAVRFWPRAGITVTDPQG